MSPYFCSTSTHVGSESILNPHANSNKVDRDGVSGATERVKSEGGDADAIIATPVETDTDTEEVSDDASMNDYELYDRVLLRFTGSQGCAHFPTASWDDL